MSAAITKAKTFLPMYSDPTLHHTGYAPSSIALGAARQSLLHASNYRRSGCLCIAERDDGTDSTYHVFYPAITPADGTTVNILFTILCHDYYAADTFDVVITDATNTSTTTYSCLTTTPAATQDGYTEIKGTQVKLLWAATVSTATDYNMVKVQVSHARVGAFTAHMVPEADQTELGVYGLDPGNFAAGLRLKGYNRTSGQNGYVDSLIQNQNAFDMNTRSFLNDSRPCIFGWACGNGRYLGTGATGYNPLMVDSFRPYVMARNLTRGTDPVTVDICMALRCDNGAKVKFTSSVDSFEASPSGHATVDPVYASGQLEIDPMGDEISIELYRTATVAIEIHAIAIFERTIGATV